MDIRQRTTGTTLSLPIAAPSGLFSVGDAHGAQGDSEVSGTGIEMEATATLRFGLLRGHGILQPQFRVPHGRNLCVNAHSEGGAVATRQHASCTRAGDEDHSDRRRCRLAATAMP